MNPGPAGRHGCSSPSWTSGPSGALKSPVDCGTTPCGGDARHPPRWRGEADEVEVSHPGRAAVGKPQAGGPSAKTLATRGREERIPGHEKCTSHCRCGHPGMRNDDGAKMRRTKNARVQPGRGDRTAGRLGVRRQVRWVVTEGDAQAEARALSGHAIMLSLPQVT